MATLMKAKTANTKAKSVDKLQLTVDYVAKQIAEAVSYGAFTTDVYVREEFAADVKQILLTAGYSVSSFSMFGSVTPTSVAYTKRGFFAKFLAWFDRDDSPGDGVFTLPDCEGSIRIDWSLVRETDKA